MHHQRVHYEVINADLYDKSACIRVYKHKYLLM